MRVDARAGLFWAGALVFLVFRLFLSSDLSVQISYLPHDDSLYVERAYHLLRGEGFGPYDSRILVKYPGLSLWLAGMRELGVPFLFSVNALYVIAGFYMAWALLCAHANRWIVLAALALYLLNPITFGYEWIRVLREPLGTGIFVLILAAMVHVFVGIEQNRRPWWHLLVLAPAFAFALFLREDDRLLWGLLLIFGAALAWQVLRRPDKRAAVPFLLAALLCPAMTAKAYEYGLREFVERHYGLPIVHELGEGEYPRLLAAVRSIRSAKDNRMVMVTQEALGKLREEVPIFRPVIDRLPPPGPRTFSCRIHGVCTEWSNGWMLYWIRDEAYRAGLTPTLPAAQHYFRKVAETIRQACQSHLPCAPKGNGLIPPMELRWARAYVVEGWRLLKDALAPRPNTVTEPARVYAVSPQLARVYHDVTMTSHFATEAQDPQATASLQGTWREWLAIPLQSIAAVLLIGAFITLGFRLWNADRRPLDAVALAGAVFALYCVARLAVLAYVAVYMGAFDPRMVFSIYAAGVILALPFIACAFMRPEQPDSTT